MHVDPNYRWHRAVTHVVTYWHIPRGVNYDRAYLITCFCTEEEAQRLDQQLGNPPEMAVSCTYDRWRRVHIAAQRQRRIRKIFEAAERELEQSGFWLQE